MLLDADFRELEPTVVGVNHLPFMTKLRIGDDDHGLDRLRMLLDGPAEALDAPLPFAVPDMIGYTMKPAGEPWTKADLLDVNRVKVELFRRFGALPAAGDRHLTEYFPGFVTEASEWGKRWGVRLITIEEREEHERMYAAGVDEQLAATELSTMPSGEMLAPVIDSMRTNRRRTCEAQIPRIEPMAWWEGSSSRKERPVGMMKKLFLLGVGGAAGKVLLDKRRGTQREPGPNAGVAGVVDTPTGTDPNAKYTAAGFEDKSIGQAVNQDAELAERLLAESDGDTAEAERRFQEESAGAPKLQAQARDTEPG
jgi:hypothetical protein